MDGVNTAEWSHALAELRIAEKAHTQEADRLAALRRRLPRERVAQGYRFEGPGGEASLVDLFDGRRQLIVYHHMLKPADPHPCSGCCMVADQFPKLAHLHARDTSLVMVARAPLAEIDALKVRLGWDVPFYASLDGFGADFDVSDGFGLNVFLREGDTIYRTYFTSGRGVETLGTVWTLLDLTPMGRQETWEDSPEGTPQTTPYRWWRLNDAYGTSA